MCDFVYVCVLQWTTILSMVFLVYYKAVIKNVINKSKVLNILDLFIYYIYCYFQTKKRIIVLLLNVMGKYSLL